MRIQRRKSRFMKFVNLYRLSRLIVPSFQVYMTLFCCSALSLALFMVARTSEGADNPEQAGKTSNEDADQIAGMQ